MRSFPLLFFLAAGCIAVRYDTVIQKSSHNSFERSESLFDQLVYYRIRSFELDVWTTQGFAVYHNQSMADPNHTNCKTLSDCVDVFETFHRMTPQHEVVTVWIEPTDYQQQSLRTPFPTSALEAIVSRLPLFTPKDLKSGCPRAKSLLDAAMTCKFPTTDQLRGKFIFVLMHGATNEEHALEEYLGPSDGSDRLLFVAPDLKVLNQVGSRASVFINDDAAKGLFGSGGVVRLEHRDDCDQTSASWWSGAEGLPYQHIATDCVNYLYTPWATTHNSNGWPFECVPKNRSDCQDRSEQNDLIGIEATSYNIDGRSDDFVFAYAASSDPQFIWTAFVAAPSSHVTPQAKGCLMARASVAADSPYFGICRPADQDRVRVQWRAHAGDDTTKIELDAVDPEKTAAFVSLRAEQHGPQTCFTGVVSPNNQDWYSTQTASICLDGTFPLQGLAVNSNGGPARILFGHVRRVVGGVETTINKSMLGNVQWIGVGAPGLGRAWDGPIAP